MGCDIHSIAQVRKNGNWETVAGRVNEDPRSYDMFAVLADVRNGSGFAGVKTGEGWPVISYPRGIPEDLTLNDEDALPCPTWYYCFDEEKKEPQTSVWMGDHSHSWLLLSEMTAFAKEKFPESYTRHGIVEREEFERIQKGKIKTPTSWCGSVSGRDVIITTADDIENGSAPAGWNYVKMKWEDKTPNPYFFELVATLKEIAAKNDVSHNEVRLVFGFDS
jgi:hypothetical protein